MGPPVRRQPRRRRSAPRHDRPHDGITKDVTEYTAHLAPGQNVTVGVHLGSWVGNGILATVRLEFYADDAAASPSHAAALVG